jgi:hypothetical protein
MDARDIFVKALHNGGGLNVEAHKAVVKAAGNAACKAWLKVEEENLEGLKSSGGRKMDKCLGQMDKTGAWPSVIPNPFDGMELSQEEFQDNLAICYSLHPRGLPGHCNGCREPFTVEHGLSCKKGGFVGQQHDDICKESAHLCSMALTPSWISFEPKIFYGRDLTVVKRPANEVLGDEAHGDVGAQGFWKRERTTIFDVQACNTDTKSYGNHVIIPSLQACSDRSRKWVSRYLAIYVLW